MTATPNFASGPGAEAGASAAPALNAGPFVLNLCSSTTPMALAQTDLPELRRFTFFVSRRFEEGRERFRLHMGYFATLAEAEEWLGVVREIYPGAWAGETPGRKLRERAAAAAAAQAQHAAGPQTQIPATPAARTPPPTEPPRTAAPRPVVTPPAPARVPVVHAAPPLAPPPARPATRPATASAKTGVSTASPAASPRSAPVARPSVPVARPAVKTPGRVPAAPIAPAPRTPMAQRNPPTAVSGATAAPASAAAPVAAASPSAAAASRAAKPGVKPVFEDSNVREVLKALGDASATGETRLMRAPPPPRESPPANPSLSDTQVLKMLETRRSAESGAGTAEVDDSGIPLLKPDDTGTRRALKEAIVTNTAVSFAVQLQWSVQPVELDKVPPLAIFSAYTLYTVEGSRDGRKWYGLRLGFFSDAISAKQVAYYVRSEFTSVAVVPVSPQEKSRATEQDAAAALAVPVPTRSDRIEEFKLIDDDDPPRLPTVPTVSARAAPSRLAAAAAAKLPPKVAVGRTVAPPATVASPGTVAPPGTVAQPGTVALPGAPVKPRVRNPRVAARDSRGPQTLEETLEILGASQLTIDDGRSATINDSGVRHLRVEVHKNSPFSKLLERLSERLKKS
jgi:hypothetical protein